MSDDKTIYHKVSFLVPVHIPDGGVKCPDCKGEGELRVGFDGGHDFDFMSCVLCSGKGYLIQEDIDMWNRIGSKHAKATMVNLKEINKK